MKLRASSESQFRWASREKSLTQEANASPYKKDSKGNQFNLDLK